MKFSAQKFSIVLALLLVAYNAIIHITHNLYNKQANYVSLIVYFIGIFFITYKIFQQNKQQNFGELFSKAIRTVVLTTLFIVVWAFIAQYIFPEVKQDYITNMQLDLQKANQPIADVEKTIDSIKKYFTLMYVSKNIFIYGFVGAFFTLVSCVSVRIMK